MAEIVGIGRQVLRGRTSIVSNTVDRIRSCTYHFHLVLRWSNARGFGEIDDFFVRFLVCESKKCLLNANKFTRPFVFHLKLQNQLLMVIHFDFTGENVGIRKSDKSRWGLVHFSSATSSYL